MKTLERKDLKNLMGGLTAIDLEDGTADACVKKGKSCSHTNQDCCKGLTCPSQEDAKCEK